VRHRARHHRIPARSEASGSEPQDHGRSHNPDEGSTHEDPCHDGEAIDKPREDLSKYAPRIETIKINPEKIGGLIGPGGKTIKGIVAETGAEINIEDDGSVHIYATSPESMARAKEIIGGMSKEIEVDQTYHGRVVSIKEFGAFVEVFPGKDGLVHISELADFRVNRTEDVAKVGEMIWVKCIGIDDKGPRET
jgi:polyribonucleotide nucleotidyltransferase